MDKVYDLLMEIKKRPEIYIGNHSIERLYAFISGFRFYEHYALNTYESCCLDGFNEYVAKLYNFTETYNWSTMIELVAGSKENKALAKFFELLDEYLKTKL